MSVPSVLLLLLLGIVASALGALGGLGGAFIALPVLRFVGVPAQTAAAASLAMALANAAGASWEYGRQRRIDMKIAGLFALTGVPASVAGAYAVQHVSGVRFDYLLAVLQIGIACSLIWRTLRPPKALPGGDRRIRDAYGNVHEYRLKPGLVLGAGLVVGFAASFFGIGGGILMVPLMIVALGMPTHFATATSTFAIFLTSPTGILTHFYLERAGLRQTLILSGLLAAGGLIGGQLGARLAPKMKAAQLTWIFAGLLIAAACGLIGRHALHFAG
jgi:uncharacterized membrane protein YfcA